MEKLLSKIKDGNSKRQIENIVIFIILLIIVIIVINSLFENDDAEVVDTNIVEIEKDNFKSNDLESKLNRILSKISGVGSVDVMISYSNTVEQVPMYDLKESTTTVEESDVNGGTRKTKETLNEQNIIYEEKSSTRLPAIKQTVMPEIIGVIVVAEGSNNSVVKENIKNAVTAAVDIPSHRIQVFAK